MILVILLKIAYMYSVYIIIIIIYEGEMKFTQKCEQVDLTDFYSLLFWCFTCTVIPFKLKVGKWSQPFIDEHVARQCTGV
jgi:hypothetical protein